MEREKIALVDNDLLGGTCTNYGCDAKILLDVSFEFVEGSERYSEICVEQNSKIDRKKLMAYKKKVLDAHTVQAGDKKISTEYIGLKVLGIICAQALKTFIFSTL